MLMQDPLPNSVTLRAVDAISGSESYTGLTPPLSLSESLHMYDSLVGVLNQAGRRGDKKRCFTELSIDPRELSAARRSRRGMPTSAAIPRVSSDPDDEASLYYAIRRGDAPLPYSGAGKRGLSKAAELERDRIRRKRRSKR